MSADSFQRLYGSDVKKDIKEATEERQFGPLPLYLHKHIHRLQENGPLFRQMGWPSGKHWPEKAGPIDPQYRMAPCEKAGSELEALNPTIIDGVEVKVTGTVRIKRLLEIKAENFQARQIQVGGKNWHQIKLI